MSEVLTFLQTVPSQKTVQNEIRELVRSGNIKWTLHVKERMEERGITILQVRNCLLKGRVVKIEDNDSEDGVYVARVEKVVAGVKVRVVVKVHVQSLPRMIKVITVMAI